MGGFSLASGGVFYFMMYFLISLLLFVSFRNMADCFMSRGRSLDCEDDIGSKSCFMGSPQYLCRVVCLHVTIEDLKGDY